MMGANNTTRSPTLSEPQTRSVQQLMDLSIDVTPLAVDLSDEDAVMGLADRALEVLGRVDILVNNAGASWGAPAEDYPLEGWDKVMTLNVRNLFLLTREIGRRSMIPNGGGRVVNVASNAALGGNRGFMQAVGYNTSKGAVVTFTRAPSARACFPARCRAISPIATASRRWPRGYRSTESATRRI